MAKMHYMNPIVELVLLENGDIVTLSSQDEEKGGVQDDIFGE